jgi:hypothetical protein
MLAAEQVGQFGERDVHLRLDGGQDGVAIRLDTMRALVAPLRLGPRRAACAPCPYPAHRARGRHAEPLGRGAARHAAIDRRNQPGSQIF